MFIFSPGILESLKAKYFCITKRTGLSLRETLFQAKKSLHFELHTSEICRCLEPEDSMHFKKPVMHHRYCKLYYVKNTYVSRSSIYNENYSTTEKKETAKRSSLKFYVL